MIFSSESIFNKPIAPYNPLVPQKLNQTGPNIKFRPRHPLQHIISQLTSSKYHGVNYDLGRVRVAIPQRLNR